MLCYTRRKPGSAVQEEAGRIRARKGGGDEGEEEGGEEIKETRKDEEGRASFASAGDDGKKNTDFVSTSPPTRHSKHQQESISHDDHGRCVPPSRDR